MTGSPGTRAYALRPHPFICCGDFTLAQYLVAMYLMPYERTFTATYAKCARNAWAQGRPPYDTHRQTIDYAFGSASIAFASSSAIAAFGRTSPRKPSTVPSRSRTASSWLAFSLPSSRSIGISMPTIARSSFSI